MREVHNGDDAIRRKVASLSAFYEYYLTTEEMSRNPVRKFTLPPRKDKEIVILEKDEVEILLKSLEDQSIWTKKEERLHRKTKFRDIALYTLLLSTGLRISEATGLNMKDLDLRHREFRIIRKGGKSQIIGMNDKVFDTISDYIEYERPFLIVNEDEPALFMSLRKSRLSPRQVETMTKTINERLFPLKHITPHKLRSTFGTNFQRKNKDIYLTASALGHSDVATTKKRYARQEQEEVTNAFKDFI